MNGDEENTGDVQQPAQPVAESAPDMSTSSSTVEEKVVETFTTEDGEAPVEVADEQVAAEDPVAGIEEHEAPELNEKE